MAAASVSFITIALSGHISDRIGRRRIAFIEYFPEAIFHLNGCPSESCLGQQQSAGIENA
jgi:hypothetical protein